MTFEGSGMSWKVELGVSGHESNVFYNGEKVGGIQKLKIVATAEGLTQMELTVADVKMKGTLHDSDSVIINGKRIKTCPSCNEIEKRIKNKGW